MLWDPTTFVQRFSHFLLLQQAAVNIVPEIFPIPNEEPFYNENISGTTSVPWLYKITEGKDTSRSLLFHMKVGENYYQYARYRIFKIDHTKMGTRCVNYTKWNKTGNCKATGRIQFNLDPAMLNILPIPAEVKNIHNWTVLESFTKKDHTCVPMVGNECVYK